MGLRTPNSAGDTIMSTAPSGLLRHVHRLVAAPGLDRLTDRQLLRRFADEGDQEAFALLLRRHGPMVLGVCRRLLGHEQDSEDAFQATFLTLARKAGAVRQADPGGYLYRVAYHLATRARAGAARRKELERQANAPSPADPAGDLSWREVRAVVDEELGRVPAEARSAVVLCYLEGKTHEEAARQLGWSKSTLRRRLEKGRELLRKRLLARGLAPLAALTATLFAEGAASPVSALLLSRTLRAVASSTAVTPAVAALAEVGTGIPSAGTRKLAVVVLVAMSALTAIGLWACRGLADPPSKPAEELPPTKRKAESDRLTVRGRVLGPDGKPVAGARIYSSYRYKPNPAGRTDTSITQRCLTDAAGRFQLNLERDRRQLDGPVPLLATADGFGLDWVELPYDGRPHDVTLALVKDVPVRCRFVTTEGEPAPRVSVNVTGLMTAAKLDDVLGAYQRDMGYADEGTDVRRLSLPLSDLLNVRQSDKDGVVEIRGLGAERLAMVEVKNVAIVPALVVVVTRPGFEARGNLRGADRGDGMRTPPFVGPKFDHVVLRPTDSTLEGKVCEAGSGSPVAGAVVRVGGLTAVTDSEGHYRIRGSVPDRRQYSLFVAAPAGSSLIGRWSRVAPEALRETLRTDFELVRGVVVTGRVFDKSTGKGVGNCSVRFAPLPENKTPAGDLIMSAKTDADGRFRLVAIPGPGVLLAQARGTSLKISGVPIYPYMAAEFDAADRARVKMTDQVAPDRAFLSSVGAESLGLNDACKVVDVKAGGEALSCDMALDPGKTLTVDLQDPDGKPLEGVSVAGVSARILRTVPFKTATATIYALDPAKPRQVFFLQAVRKLSARVTLRGDEKDPLVVRLTPTAVVTGRALDEDGQPLAGAEVYPVYSTPSGAQFNRARETGRPVLTDREGRFRLEAVVPGLPMEIGFRGARQEFVPEKRSGIKPLESGESLDVGAIRTKLAGS
jgi:RNA polymerase sigma factor (sigma-70 family)